MKKRRDESPAFFGQNRLENTVITCYNSMMSQAKLQKIGNSLGFRIPKTELEAAGFDESFDYELIAERGVILLVKKRPHSSKWIFKDTALSKEDREWLESDLENRNS